MQITTIIALTAALLAQSFSFAVLTDTHVSGPDSPAGKVLRECIRDINTLPDIDFVLHCGDETDFGTDEEEICVKAMLDSLRVPLYAIPGNHDATWSESGCNTFERIYGAEHFCFTHKGWRFVGIPSGPDVRMSPALISRESLCFVDSLNRDPNTIFVNHYPANDEISNHQEFLQKASDKGACFFVGGHHHVNTPQNYHGIPGILCRSSITNKHSEGIGYTIINIEGNHITAEERRAAAVGKAFRTQAPWYEATLSPGKKAAEDGTPVFGPADSCNAIVFRQVWRSTESANIAAGFACNSNGDKAWYGTTAGDFCCIRISDGAKLWKTRLGGKIYSTPALCGRIVVTGCADGCIYALDAEEGSVKWKFTTGKAVLASPVIFKGKVYIGGSDGVFRALRLRDGCLLWENRNIRGHVITRPYVDRQQVVFGSWGRTLYSLDPRTGVTQWEWTHPHGSRMYSPAACWCVKSQGKIFVSIPDRKLWAFESRSGQPLWTVSGAREAIGLSEDGHSVYTKSMFSRLLATDARMSATGGTPVELSPIWDVETPLGYDISPTAIVCRGGRVFVPSDKGAVHVFDSSDGKSLGGWRFSTALVNPICVIGEELLLCSAMDGVIVLLEAKNSY